MRDRTISSSQFVMILGVSAVLFFLALLPLELIPEIPVDIDQKPFFIPLVLVALLPRGRAVLAVALGAALGEGLRDLMEGYELDDPFGFVGYVVAFLMAARIVGERPRNRFVLALAAVVCGAIQSTFEAATFLLFGEESVPVAVTSAIGNTITHGILWGAIPLAILAPRMHGRFERFLGLAPKGTPPPERPLVAGESAARAADPAALVDVRGVAFRYPATEMAALVDVAFTIHRGEIVGLIGPSGAGRSTLCQVLAGLAPRTTGGELAGHARVGETNLAVDAEARPSVGLLTGAPAAQLTQVRARDEVASVHLNAGVDGARAQELARERLDAIGLDRALHDRYTWELTETQQRLVTLAAALAAQPELLVLDDVFGGLDPRSQAAVLAAVREHAERHAVLVADDDPDRLLDYAHRVVVLHGGRVRAQGAANEMLGDQALMNGLGFEVPLALATSASTHRGAGADEPSGRAVSARTDSAAPSVAVRLDGVTAGYDDRPPVLDGLDLVIHRGAVHGVLGASGAGKSTLARTLAGLLTPRAGRVYAGQRDVTRLDLAQRLALTGVVLDDPDMSLAERTVRAEILAPLRYEPLDARERAERLDRALRQARLDPRLLDADPTALPRLQRRQVQIASALVRMPEALVVDDPIRHLGGAQRSELVGILTARARDGQAVVLLDHDADFLAEVATRISVLGHGRVLAEGTPEKLFAPENAELLATLGLLLPRATRLGSQRGLRVVRRDEFLRRLASEPA